MKAHRAPLCPLCEQRMRPFHHRGSGDPSPGDYYRCQSCGLIVLDPAAWPDPASEQTHYRTHENRPDDAGYRAHLERLAGPLRDAQPPPARGLDWGCGPQPVLAGHLEALGYTMHAWDPLFGPACPPTPDAGWDFITCTEVLEHLHEPLATLELMATRLRPGGLLALMTEWPPLPDRFRRWHYRRDPTHVAFYGPATLQELARRLDGTLALPCRDIALLRIPRKLGLGANKRRRPALWPMGRW